MAEAHLSPTLRKSPRESITSKIESIKLQLVGKTREREKNLREVVHGKARRLSAEGGAVQRGKGRLQTEGLRGFSQREQGRNQLSLACWSWMEELATWERSEIKDQFSDNSYQRSMINVVGHSSKTRDRIPTLRE